MTKGHVRFAGPVGPVADGIEPAGEVHAVGEVGTSREVHTVGEGEPLGRLIAEMYAIHAVLRRACDILVTAAQRSGTDEATTVELHRFGTWTAQAVTHHHHGEEAVFWPEVCNSNPQAQEILDGLTKQHAELDIVVSDLGAALSTRSEPSTGAGARLATTAVRLRDALGAHLEAEERDLPGLLGHIDRAQAGELSRTIARTAPRRDLCNFVGLVVDTSPDGQRPVLFAHLPLPIRWARRPLYRRYRHTLATLSAGGAA